MTTAKYVFWDCDNTLVHTAEHHWRKNVEVLKRYGTNIPIEHKHRVFLMGSRQNYEWYTDELGFDCPIDDYLTQVDEWFLSNAHEIKIRKGVLEALEHFKSKNIPQAVVSNGRTNSVRAVLDAKNLTPYFDAMLCKEDYEGRKPDPEPYLAGIRTMEKIHRLKINPTDCLAIEDEEKGEISAKAAGMNVIYRPLSDNDTDNDLLQLI